MQTLVTRLVDAGTGQPVASTVFMAASWWTRLRGLIGRAPLGIGEAFWIRPCSQVHTHFMNVPIHVAFLDPQLTVISTIDTLRPWRVSPWVREANSVLEFSASAPLPVSPGQRLRVQG